MSDRKSILAALHKKNKQISRADRAQLWAGVESFMPKPTFYKIITGEFCSEANTEYAKAILSRMDGFIESQKQRVKALKQK